MIPSHKLKEVLEILNYLNTQIIAVEQNIKTAETTEILKTELIRKATLEQVKMWIEKNIMEGG